MRRAVAQAVKLPPPALASLRTATQTRNNHALKLDYAFSSPQGWVGGSVKNEYWPPVFVNEHWPPVSSREPSFALPYRPGAGPPHPPSVRPSAWPRPHAAFCSSVRCLTPARPYRSFGPLSFVCLLSTIRHDRPEAPFPDRCSLTPTFRRFLPGLRAETLNFFKTLVLRQFLTVLHQPLMYLGQNLT